MPSMIVAYFSAVVASLSLIAASPLSVQLEARDVAPVAETVCNGLKYTYQQLAGYGFIASDARDKFGDTIGGIGSGMAFDKNRWRKTAEGKYEGEFWAIPDRGWNTEGTLNIQNRVHKFAINLTLASNATAAKPAGRNLAFRYLDTVLLTGPDGTPVTGLDADASGSITYRGFPDLPVATYTGDGFGNAGSGGRRIPVDSESLVINGDGSIWVSDEYGPYIYKFGRDGRMQQAIRPPEAYIPRRNGSVSFSAASPPRYKPNVTITPTDTDSGRDNNQGLEGLTISADGNTLYALMQSALDQEGGPKQPQRLQTRLLIYNTTTRDPVYAREYVVTLPVYTNSAGQQRAAGSSEIHYLTPTQLLILTRDSGAGHGQTDPTSVFRHIDIIDISAATNIKSAANDAATGSIASSAGVLKTGIVAAKYCPWIDMNINSQLNKFGAHNGGAQDSGLLNEKWESISVVSTNPGHGSDNNGNEYFIFAMSDNDFVTQNGFVNFGKLPYKDKSGFNLDNQMLVYQVTLPSTARPVAGED